MPDLSDILHSIRPEVDFTLSSHFIEDGLLDSFDMVTLVATLDKTYGISIDGVDIVPENFQNIETIAALLRKNGAAA
jgi:acyl carrier protein